MINTLALLGVGLIGGSLARAAHEAGAVGEIIGLCRSRESGAQAHELGVIDVHAASVAEAVKHADMIVLAVPMGAMRDVLAELAPAAPERSVVTDVGSVKQSLIDDVRQVCPELLPRLVPAHPIAGKERSGVAASTADLFRGRNTIVTPTADTEAAGLDQVTELWRSVGARVLTMTPAEHDRIFALTSHLPHVIAYALVSHMAAEDNREQLFQLAAGGFYDFTRIASSDPVMWRDVCLTNRDAILAALSGYRETLDRLLDWVDAADAEQIEQMFRTAKQARDAGKGEGRA